ncbi:hypothetical protein [Lactiplantibacillus plantarum]|uniref:hypothetical protein n=1 Tax=Lactiplantibacillus plantarum TaxID=1590 RepID=UPI003709AF47
MIVAITEEYAFRGMIFRTLLALNLKKFATLQATIASMMTASLILRLCIWSTFYHSPYGQYCVKFSMLLVRYFTCSNLFKNRKLTGCH